MSTGRGILQTDAGGANIRVRLRGEDSEGELAVIEEVLEADFEGPPLHVHPSFEEGFYVLEGELTFRMEDETVSGGHGTIVFAPRGVPHTFANLSGRRARALFCARLRASSAISSGWPGNRRASSHPTSGQRRAATLGWSARRSALSRPACTSARSQRGACSTKILAPVGEKPIGSSVG